jgi:hypothetical protein
MGLFCLGAGDLRRTRSHFSLDRSLCVYVCAPLPSLSLVMLCVFGVLVCVRVCVCFGVCVRSRPLLLLLPLKRKGALECMVLRMTQLKLLNLNPKTYRTRSKPETALQHACCGE